MRDIGLAVRSGYRQHADATRVISRLFIPGQEIVGGGVARTTNTVERVLALSEAEVDEAVDELFERFAKRHHDLWAIFERHAERVSDHLSDHTPLSPHRRQLLGAAFTHEYSIEGAAVCNPSLVPHPDQSHLNDGDLRVVLSYRCISEGHHSSIGFRTGIVNGAGTLTMDEPAPFPVVASIAFNNLDRDLMRAKLRDLGNDDELTASVQSSLGPEFSTVDLEMALAKLAALSGTRIHATETATALRYVASCFYEASFDSSIEFSRRVLWPTIPAENHGMEDARFVWFEDGEESRYLASYTAFDGRDVTQQLLETADFERFTSSPLAGVAARNKGLAIFPRRIDGRFAALSRHDRETNAISLSDDLHVWNEVSQTQLPFQPWEIIQLGNCGSPIELPEGWLVITHGVGPMRTYGISALLLDLNDPTIVLGQLPKPLLLPSFDEQDGYVPNVVYSCGSLIHGGTLVLPYGIADGALSFASVDVAQLLGAFEEVERT